VLRIEPVGRVFSYLAGPPRGEVGQPRRGSSSSSCRGRMRPFAALPLVIPVNGLLYAAADGPRPDNRRDVFFFALLAEKPHPG